MKFAPFEYVCPRTPEEAVRALASRPGEAKLIAGGQSLLPTMAFRLAQPSLLVDLRQVDALRGIEIGPQGTRLGARTRWRDIEDHAGLARAQPLLVEAIRHVAHYQVRNRGTVGGSLAHADPAAEMPCIAVTCEARLRVLGPAGERTVGAGDLFTGPLSTVLGEDEVILDVTLPAWPAGRRWAFTEFSRRPGDFALAGLALFYDLKSDGRVCNAHVGVVGSSQRPERLRGAEAALEGARLQEEGAAAVARVAKAAFAEFDVEDDHHASAAYRKSLLATLVTRALGAAMTRN